VPVVSRAFACSWLAVSILVGCGPAADDGGETVSSVLPATAAGWVADGDEQLFDTESIYGYINGHAEVYLAYGMKRCVSRRYRAADGDGEIVVDLFEMASPADAYGVFSHDRDGDEVEVGQGGIYRLGWLSFWKGPWYGSVYATGVSDGMAEAVLAVARAAVVGVSEGGGVPALVDRLPVENLDPTSVCFLRSPQILNAHVFVGSDNILGLGPQVDAVVGEYVSTGGAVHLVLVEYPDEAAAEAVEERALEAARSGADGPGIILARDGALVAAVVGDERGELNESLLDVVMGGES
jgi:hypothetical protein